MPFSRHDGELHCDGVSLDTLARAHGTPLYVYSAATLAASFDAYEKAFAPVPHRVCYALKANASGALLRRLAARGAGADIVSGGELQAALRAGFPPGRIVFSGVAKSDAEMQAAVDAGIAAFNAESEEEVARLSTIGERAGRRLRVALRVNPDIDAKSHPYISTGQAHNKFGIDIAQAPHIFRASARYPGVSLVGVQSHIGSQITTLEPMGQAAEALAELSRRLMADGFPLETVDIGGGLGFGYQDGRGPSPADLAARVLPVIAPLGLEVLLEPGRSIAAGAGVLLTRVESVKENRGHTFVVVDAGMNDLMRPALYGAFHAIEPVAGREGATRVVDVVGPVCESGDFLARDRELATCVRGDLLAVRDAGAYGFSMGSSYNMRPRPAEVLVEDGQGLLIRRRQTFDDLVREEL
jgi:diaminopimelate decarboxylase